MNPRSKQSIRNMGIPMITRAVTSPAQPPGRWLSASLLFILCLYVTLRVKVRWGRHWGPGRPLGQSSGVQCPTVGVSQVEGADGAIGSCLLDAAEPDRPS